MKKVYALGLVDALAFSLFTFLVSTGGVLLLKLPPGSGQRLSLWELSRHEWGGIHSVIASIFLLVLVVHIAMHYKWTVAIIQGSDRTQKSRRLAIATVVVVGFLLASLIPLVVSVDVVGR